MKTLQKEKFSRLGRLLLFARIKQKGGKIMRRILGALLIWASLILLLLGARSYQKEKIRLDAGYERQHKEEAFLDEFLKGETEERTKSEAKRIDTGTEEEIVEETEEDTNEEMAEDTEEATEEEKADQLDGEETSKYPSEHLKEEAEGTVPKEAFSDNNYYEKDGFRFTPEFAKGSLQSVLEIPSIRLRRGVYQGSKEEREHNLGIWMTVPSASWMKPGETPYVILGHNHTEQDLSFNRLPDLMHRAFFYLKQPGREYRYQVTEIRGMERAECEKLLYDNPSLPKEACYIVTCGRGKNRYKNLVVKGVRVP